MIKDPKKILRELQQGCYVLTEDVTNPRPDRRATRDWTNAETWKKGMRLFVRESEEHDILGTGRTFTFFQIEGIDERWQHMNIRKGQHDADRWNAITAKMKAVPEDLDGLLHRLDAGGWSRARILEQLVKDNKVTLAEVEAAYVAAMKEEDPVTTATEDAS